MPSFSAVFESLDDVELPANSVLFAGESPEPRSKSTVTFAARADIDFVKIEETGPYEISIGGRVVSLRNVDSLAAALTVGNPSQCVIDITGLTHPVWSGLIRAAWASGIPMWACYVEPAEYKFSRVPTQSAPFDLSLSIQGLEPLPGFARLRREGADPVVVALLGFEGARFGYLLEQLEVLPDHVIPVVGAPGFRIEYPLFAFVGNRRSLWNTGAYGRVRYAAANDPFHLFYCLEEIRSEFAPDRPFVVAPIGTKPHSLGSVLYALHDEEFGSGAVELAYDHPNRNPRRTRGESRLLLYHVSEFRAYLANAREHSPVRT